MANTSTYTLYTATTKAEAIWLHGQFKAGVIPIGPKGIADLLGVRSYTSLKQWIAKGVDDLPEVSPERQRELLALAGVEVSEPEGDNLPAILEAGPEPADDNHHTAEMTEALGELVYLRLKNTELLLTVGNQGKEIGQLRGENEELKRQLEDAYIRAQDDVKATEVAADMRLEAERARGDHYLQTITYMVEEMRRNG